jgi:hypothetical protein
MNSSISVFPQFAKIVYIILIQKSSGLLVFGFDLFNKWWITVTYYISIATSKKCNILANNGNMSNWRVCQILYSQNCMLKKVRFRKTFLWINLA